MKALVECNRALTATDFRADLAKIEVPTLIVHGDRDKVVDVETGRGLAGRMPHARLEVLAGIGHVPQLEEPRRVARLTEAFLRGAVDVRVR